MTHRGIIENGIVRPIEPISLPEGTEVEIRPVQESAGEGMTLKESNRRFWSNPSLEQLTREAGVKPIEDISELAGDWPPEDDIEEFLRHIRRGRQ